MLGIVLAALLAFSPQGGTVYTAEGGRVRGTVLDAGPGGVTVQLADGSQRKVEAEKVSRIDFVDGTSWKLARGAPAATAQAAPAAAPAQSAAPVAPPLAAPVPSPVLSVAVAAPVAPPVAVPALSVAVAAPVAPPVPAPVAAPTAAPAAAAAAPVPVAQAAQPAAAPVPVAATAAAPAVPAASARPPTVAPAPAAASKPAGIAIPIEKLDTVYVARGGRVRAFVVEDGPEGVVVRLVDGAERRFGPGEVTRIDWADGTRSEYSAGAPAAATVPAAIPTPAATPTR